jgi:ribulose kinase
VNARYTIGIDFGTESARARQDPGDHLARYLPDYGQPMMARQSNRP